MACQARVRIGTRGSPLALVQAEETRRRLLEAHPDLAPGEVALEVIRTTGDRERDRPLAEIGGKGLFTKEIEEALFDGRVDLAVHSMKDVPTEPPPGLVIDCLLPREDPRDAFISERAARLGELPTGAVVGTASLRRKAQVLAARPDLEVVTLRGNVDTRLRKLRAGEIDATLLALSGLRRLERLDRVTSVMEVAEMLPAVAQGAIGIQRRQDDGDAAALLAPLNHGATATCVAAERAFLAALDGSCRTPIAALAELDESSALRLRGLLLEPDGSRVYEAERAGAAGEAEAMGRDAGEELRRAAGPDFFAALP
jgi:hydroxymethylbilane synthase